jgi:hypothetical protein
MRYSNLTPMNADWMTAGAVPALSDTPAGACTLMPDAPARPSRFAQPTAFDEDEEEDDDFVDDDEEDVDLADEDDDDFLDDDDDDLDEDDDVDDEE